MRSRESLRHHFEVERELASRLRVAPKSERPQLYSVLYEELFRRVPDHPRLVRRDTPEQSAKAVQARMSLLDDLLKPDKVFLEIAPGDCRLCCAVAARVAKAIGVDISDQSAGEARPDNFQLVVYDGVDLNLPECSADIVFSYQFLEHIHPEDVPDHFAMMQRVLKPGGCYVFDTPHAFSGPHDVSRHFSAEPEGFHLKEWTYRELRAVALKAGFASALPWRKKLAFLGSLAGCLTLALEGMLGLLPRSLRWRLSQRLFAAVTMRCVKA